MTNNKESNMNTNEGSKRLERTKDGLILVVAESFETVFGALPKPEHAPKSKPNEKHP
jgi:hypothetical protein